MKRRINGIIVLLVLVMLVSSTGLALALGIKAEEVNPNISEELVDVSNLETEVHIWELDEEDTIKGEIDEGDLIVTEGENEDKKAIEDEIEEITETEEIMVMGEVRVNKENPSIEEVIRALRDFHVKKAEYTFRQALAYNYTSDRLENDLVQIATKIKINENAESAADLAGNVMSIVAAGENPYNYGDKNYVEKLTASFDPEDWPTSLAFRILALDMAGADYDRGTAIDSLINSQDEQGKWGGEWGGPDEAGMVIAALAKYKNRSDVGEAIDRALDYLKNEQDENTGGFIVWGAENPYSASAVIQGLIAVGEDPLSIKWEKNGRTLVDSLLNFYREGYFVNNDEKDEMATEQAFAALADVYREESMFNVIRHTANEAASIRIGGLPEGKIKEGDAFKLYITAYDRNNNIVALDDNIVWTSSNEDIAEVNQEGNLLLKKPGWVSIGARARDMGIEDSIDLQIHKREFLIEYMGDFEVKNGEEVKAEIKLHNLAEDTKTATLIVGLYEKDNNALLNYSMIKTQLEGGGELDLWAGFLLAGEGDFYVKAFLWDDLERQNIIMQEAQHIRVTNY